jgi:hypothetical protein
METDNNKYYYKPVPDARTYEFAMKKATFLTENLYVTLTTGYTFEDLVEELIQKETNNKSYINR